jgi:hypothetical protein
MKANASIIESSLQRDELKNSLRSWLNQFWIKTKSNKKKEKIEI